MKRSILRAAAFLAVTIILGLVTALLIYPPEYVYRVLVWQNADVYDYYRFPARTIAKDPDNSFHFEENFQEEQVSAIFESHQAVEDWDKFLYNNWTQAFIVVQDDQLLMEKYFFGSHRGAVVTSFSIAKSYTSILIGLAIADRQINAVTDPITD